MSDLLNNINLMPIAIVFAVVLFLYLKGSGKYKYKKRYTLFTPAEINFKRVLDAVVANSNLVVYGKVRIADIMTPNINRKLRGRLWWKAFTKISSKHVDYVVCDKRSYTILCAIELDDQSHNNRQTQKRDAFVNQAYRSAGIELVRVKAAKHYQPKDLLGLFSRATQQRFRSNQ